MKSAANCDTSCELQIPWIIEILNANCTPLKEGVCLLECRQQTLTKKLVSKWNWKLSPLIFLNEWNDVRDHWFAIYEQMSIIRSSLISSLNIFLDWIVKCSIGVHLWFVSDNSDHCGTQSIPTTMVLRIPKWRDDSFHLYSILRPQFRQGYPVDLSISLAGGKETN